MLQNQNNQHLKHCQIFHEGKGRLSMQYAKMLGTMPAYQHPDSMIDDDGNESEISGEHNNPEGQRNYRMLTREQRCREADQHEHPYECENSPWRRQQPAASCQGNTTYTNRY